MTDLAKCCPGCGDLGVHQVVNELDEPEWCLGDLRDEEGDPVFVCYCPYCGRQLQDPKTAPVRVSFNAGKKTNSAGRWRRGTEELPQDNRTAVLLWYGNECKIGWYAGAEYQQDSYWLFDSCEHRFDEISHWMPLPEPPK